MSKPQVTSVLRLPITLLLLASLAAGCGTSEKPTKHSPLTPRRVEGSIKLTSPTIGNIAIAGRCDVGDVAVALNPSDESGAVVTALLNLSDGKQSFPPVQLSGVAFRVSDVAYVLVDPRVSRISKTGLSGEITANRASAEKGPALTEAFTLSWDCPE